MWAHQLKELRGIKQWQELASVWEGRGGGATVLVLGGHGQVWWRGALGIATAHPLVLNFRNPHWFTYCDGGAHLSPIYSLRSPSESKLISRKELVFSQYGWLLWKHRLCSFK